MFASAVAQAMPSVLTKFRSGKQHLRVGTFFSGLGGWELAILRAASSVDKRLKCKFVFAVDKDDHCKSVLETVVCPDKVHGDVNELKVKKLPDVAPRNELLQRTSNCNLLYLLVQFPALPYSQEYNLFFRCAFPI